MSEDPHRAVILFPCPCLSPETGTATDFVGPNVKSKCRAPCSKIVKNFKVMTAEPLSQAQGPSEPRPV